MQNKILHHINFTMDKVNIYKKVINVSNNINMTYNYLTDEISFDSKRIEQNLKRYSHISLQEYVTTFTLHELGHSLDRENLLQSYDQTVEWCHLSNTLSTNEKETNPLFLKLTYLEDKANLNFEHVAWINAIHLNNEYSLVDNYVLDELKFDSLLTYEKNYARSKDCVKLEEKIPVLL